MKLKTLRMKNFRGYREETIVEFDDLTAFVGRNDAGKSSILEALDIFFNEGSGAIKFDKDDINCEAKKSGETEMVLSCSFTDLPDKIIIDATNETTLKDEFLLNSDGCLEIVKRFGSSAKPKVYVRANHPSHEKCKDLLQKKEADLRKIIKDNQIGCETQNVNSVMRKAIRDYFDASATLSIQEIDISKGDAVKSIWTDIQKHLPLYSLFKADRENDDSDDEVQDPLHEAVKQVLADNDLQSRLAEVAGVVTQMLSQVANRTLCKIREMDPNIAKSLSPRIPETSSLKWADVFKSVSITGDENVPINKRGSGVKRLILLNFFRAEVERRQQANGLAGVIYAIEEPETSQHSSYQKLLINAFKELAKLSQVQVVLTTHSPVVVKEIGDFSSLRMVLSDETHRVIQSVEECILAFPSLNEVNYLAFGEASEEYHNELFGYIDAEGQYNNLIAGQRTLPYSKLSNGVPGPVRQLPLSKVIRDQIHHPENTSNVRFADGDLRESIILMRQFVKQYRESKSV